MSNKRKAMEPVITTSPAPATKRQRKDESSKESSSHASNDELEISKDDQYDDSRIASDDEPSNVDDDTIVPDPARPIRSVLFLGYSIEDSNQGSDDTVLIEFKGVEEECHRVFNAIRDLKVVSLTNYKGEEMALVPFFESLCDPNWPLVIAKDNRYRKKIARVFDELINSTKSEQWHSYKGDQMRNLERHDLCSFVTFKTNDE